MLPSSPVQWPAVSTTVGEISVPEQRNRPSSVVNRTRPTFVCTSSRWPSTIAEAGCAVTAIPANSSRTLNMVPRRLIRYRFIAWLLTPVIGRSQYGHAAVGKATLARRWSGMSLCAVISGPQVPSLQRVRAHPPGR